MQHVPILIRERLVQLRKERGWNREDLVQATVRLGFSGVRFKTLYAIEKEPGRVPQAHIIEALAAALDVRPDAFYEWPIAEARRANQAAPSSRIAGVRHRRKPTAATLPRPLNAVRNAAQAGDRPRLLTALLAARAAGYKYSELGDAAGLTGEGARRAVIRAERERAAAFPPPPDELARGPEESQTTEQRPQRTQSRRAPDDREDSA